MRITLNIDDELLKKASELTGISQKTVLVRAALKALVEQEGRKYLAALGGTQKRLKLTRRRRQNP